MSSWFLPAAFLTFAAPSLAARRLPPTASFHEYTDFFGRTYDPASDEGQLRRTLFEARAAAARKQNEKPGALWRAALTPFTDWTKEELATLRGWRPGSRRVHRQMLGLMDTGHKSSSSPLSSDFPHEMLWESSLSSIIVPNQGACGSCWAFASAYLLRSHYENFTGTVKDFSVQQFVNCVPNPQSCGGTGGCMGATVELAMQHVTNMQKSTGKGLENFPLDTDVPYMAVDDQCSSFPSFVSTGKASGKLRGGQLKTDGQAVSTVGLKQFRSLASNDQDDLLMALLNGPVAVSVAAGSWFEYESGIFSCTDDVDRYIIDHAVLMTGFGVDATTGGTKFWKIMNSWGSEWGENGFMRLLRQDPPASENDDEDGFCGMDTSPGDGVACKDENGNYPTQVRVCGTCGILYDSVTVELGHL